MSYEERKLMQSIDKIILGSNSEKLSELQRIDRNTQLAGVWFYDTYSTLVSIPQKQDITISKPFKKK